MTKIQAGFRTRSGLADATVLAVDGIRVFCEVVDSYNIRHYDIGQIVHEDGREAIRFPINAAGIRQRGLNGEHYTLSKDEVFKLFIDTAAADEARFKSKAEAAELTKQVEEIQMKKRQEFFDAKEKKEQVDTELNTLFNTKGLDAITDKKSKDLFLQSAMLEKFISSSNRR